MYLFVLYVLYTSIMNVSMYIYVYYIYIHVYTNISMYVCGRYKPWLVEPLAL